MYIKAEKQKQSLYKSSFIGNTNIYRSQQGAQQHNETTFTMPIIQKKDDPIKSEALTSRDLKKVKYDVDFAMDKILAKLKVLNLDNPAIKTALSKIGRDAWVYAGILKKNDPLITHINNWSEEWSLENTCGLLLDIGNSVREYFPITTKMDKTMKGSRGNNHKVNKQSDWVKNLPTGSEVQAGVSATTHNLIRTLLGLKATEWGEIEAIMVGVVKYWKDGSVIKSLKGEFHTSAEVWSAYQHQLFSWYEKNNKNSIRDKDGKLIDPKQIESIKIAE